MENSFIVERLVIPNANVFPIIGALRKQLFSICHKQEKRHIIVCLFISLMRYILSFIRIKSIRILRLKIVEI